MPRYKMALIDLIRKRASIRKYSSKPVERETVLKCIEAARLAPSACNVQPWKFIVIQKQTVIERMVEAVRLKLEEGFFKV